MKNYLYEQDSYSIHDSLLYDSGVASDLDSFSKMLRSLKSEKKDLPTECIKLIQEIEEIRNTIQPKLRSRILKLYFLLTGDKSLNRKIKLL